MKKLALILVSLISLQLLAVDCDTISLDITASITYETNHESNALIDVFVSTNSGGITYLWPDDSSTFQLRENLSAGNYKVEITDELGCTNDSTFVITNSITNPCYNTSLSVYSTITNKSENDSIDGSIRLYVTGGTEPYSYLWSNDSTTKDIDGLDEGTYYLTVTDSNNCEASYGYVVENSDEEEVWWESSPGHYVRIYPANENIPVISFQTGLVIPSYYNIDAEALFNRFTEEPDDVLKQSISNWYDTIQLYNIDDSLEHRYLFAMQNRTDALLDWFSNSSATTVNSPDFVRFEGFRTDGSSSYIRTEINPANSSKFSLTSGSFGLWINTDNLVSGNWPIGIRDTPNAIAIRNDATQFYVYHNRITAFAQFAHNNNIQGYTHVSRINNFLTFERNNIPDTFSPQNYSYVGVPDQSEGIFIGALNNRGSASNYDSNQYAIFNYGAALTDLQATKLYKADSTLMSMFNDPLLVIVGQSNAAGRGYADSLSSPYSDIIPKSGLILNDDFGDEEFIRILAGSGTSDWGLRFGLEVGFAYEKQPFYDTLYIAKTAYGSTPIRKFFPDSLYYQETLNTINNALEKSGKNTIQFVWYQGEQDWFEESTTYYSDIETMFAGIIPNLNGLVLKKVMCELRYDPKSSYLTVRNDTYDYVNDNSDTYLFRTNDLGYDASGVHLQNSGYINGGIKLFNRTYIDNIVY